MSNNTWACYYLNKRFSKTQIAPEVCMGNEKKHLHSEKKRLFNRIDVVFNRLEPVTLHMESTH